MTRRLVAVAVFVGLLVAVVVAVARDTPPPASTTARTTPAAAPAPVRLVAGDALPIVRAHPDRRGVIAGTDEIAVRARDPQGGPDWAVRTYQRPALQRAGRVWCSQLGRIVDGEFAWIQPGSRVAKRLALGYTPTTVCADTSPTSDHLGVSVASAPTHPISDPRSRIGATVVWGVIDRSVREAHLEHASLGGPLQPTGHALLRVEDGPVAQPSWARLVVTDTDGGRRGATPFRLSQGMVVPIGGGHSRWDRRPPRDIPVEKVEEQFVLAARVDAVADGPPRGIFVSTKPNGDACATAAVPIVGDRGVSEYDDGTGLVDQPPMLCVPLPAKAHRMPTVIGGSWSTGADRPVISPRRRIQPGSPAARARDRRRREERLEDAWATVTVATPPGTRMLTVRSPTGAQTVRVTPQRVTTVSWRGQPEVLSALFPQSRMARGERRSRSRVPQRVVWFEALDGRGHRIGRVGSTRPVRGG